VAITWTIPTLATPTVTTSVYDATTNTAWGGSEVTGATAYDTSTVTGVTGYPPTGTVSYSLFTNGNCHGAPTSEGTGLALGSNSSTTSALAAGTYGFEASYSGDYNYSARTSGCESFVVSPPTLVITTTAIPSATDGVLYSFQLEASGGTAPYTWTVTGGSLPVGLTLSPTGVLSGTANSYPETYDFTATVNDSGSPPQTTSEPLSLVLGAPAPPPPPPPKTGVTCNGSCSTTVTTSTGTETAKGTSVGTGVIEVSVATQTLECEGFDYSPQVTDVVSTVTFPAGLKVISTIDNATDAKAYLTCYSDPTAFVDAAGNLVTTGFLAACPATITDSTGPCVISQVRKHDNVVVTIHILDGDPRFWTGKAGKTGKK
jgi:hypothetical protein